MAAIMVAARAVVARRQAAAQNEPAVREGSANLRARRLVMIGCLRTLRRELLAALLFIVPFGAWAQAGCVSGIGNADVFGYAEATFPALFPPLATSGRFADWEYRYYAGTQTYLGVQDGTCTLGLLGPLTGGALVSPGTVADFSSPILTWRTQGGACTYTVSPTSVSVDASGGTITVDVRQVQIACTVPNPPWAIASQTAWITNARAGSLSNGQGPGYFYVEPNSGSARSGTVLVAGVTVNVSQAAGTSSSLAGSYAGSWSGGCGYYGAVGGSFNVTVTAAGGVSGSYSGDDSGSFTGQITDTGSFAATGSGSGGTWSGTLRAGGSGSSGSWSDPADGCSGTWTIP